MSDAVLQDSQQHSLDGTVPKLTTWANEPTVGHLKMDWEAAKPTHDAHLLKVKRWSDLHKVEGSQKPKEIKGRSKVQPKLVRRQAEWRYAPLSEPFLSSSKLFQVKPTTFEDAKAARQNELILNWQFKTKINRVNFVDNYVRTNVDEGSAIVRVGWSRNVVMADQEVPVWQYETFTDNKQVDEFEAGVLLAQEDPNGFAQTAPEHIQKAVAYFNETGTPTFARDTGKKQKTKVEKVIENRPVLRIVNPNNFWWDPSCGEDFEKANFCIESFETNYAELLKEGKYKNLDKVNWEGSNPALSAGTDHAPISQTDGNFNFKDKARKKVIAFEYWGLWDVAGDGVLVPIVATWIGDVMIRMEENPFPDQKIPYVIANYMPIKREVMGEPDAEILEDNQKILGAVSRGMIDLLARSANGQQGFAKNMLDAVNRRRFENGQDYEFNPNINPQIGHIEHKYPEIPQSAIVLHQLQNQEAEALTGVKAFSGGISGEAFGDVATGIKGALDAASKREMSILRRLANGMVQIGRKIAAMNAVFLSEKETIRITNQEFVEVNREDLIGEYDLDVDISTAEVDNAKAQDLAFMLQTMGNNMDFSMTQLILAEIADLKRMPELAEKIRNFQPPPPDELTVRLREAEVRKLEAEARKIEAEATLAVAKTQKTEAEADAIDLDIVETETGTKHARDVEKITSQAGAVADAEVTKALLKPRKKADGGESEPDIEAAVGYNQLSKLKNDPRNKGQILTN